MPASGPGFQAQGSARAPFPFQAGPREPEASSGTSKVSPAPSRPRRSGVTSNAPAVEGPGLRPGGGVGYPAGPVDTQGSEDPMAAKKKIAAKKTAKRVAPPPKAPAKKKAAARAAARPAAKAPARGAKDEVVYSDVLRELRSSLVSRLIR